MANAGSREAEKQQIIKERGEKNERLSCAG